MTYVMSKLIPNVNDSPFEDLGLTEDDFVPIANLVGAEIKILAYKTYTKDESPGVFIAFDWDGQLGYVATHSVALVKTFEEEAVKQILDGGEPIVAKVIQRTSKKTGRQYYCFDSE